MGGYEGREGEAAWRRRIKSRVNDKMCNCLQKLERSKIICRATYAGLYSGLQCYTVQCSAVEEPIVQFSTVTTRYCVPVWVSLVGKTEISGIE